MNYRVNVTGYEDGETWSLDFGSNKREAQTYRDAQEENGNTATIHIVRPASQVNVFCVEA